MAEPPLAAPSTAGALLPDFAWPPGVRAAVTTRGMPGVSPSPFDACNLGARCGDAPANVAANRAALREFLALPSEPVWLRQVHGTAVEVLDLPGNPARDAHDDPMADAAYSDRPGLVCAVQTADCLPLLIASDDGGEVAAVHAGWRGLAAGVIEATLARFRAPPQRLRVWLGPAIAATSYEVGDEVRAAFLERDPGATEAFTATRPGHWLCDLYTLARRRLQSAGVGRVGGGGLDTFTDARFYSHRRERPTGRFASLIWIEPVAPPAGRHDGSSSPAGLTQEYSPATTRPASRSRLVFPTLLGDAFARLPPTVRALHLARGLSRYHGRVTIRRGGSALARLCALVTGMPPAMSDAPLGVDIRATGRSEEWTRHFDGHRMRSRLWRRNRRLCERLGLVTFRFALRVDRGALRWQVDSVRALGIPLPARWFRGVRAREWESEGRYHFEVAAALPLAGELVHYAGWLAVDPHRNTTPRADEDGEEEIDGPDDDGDDSGSAHHHDGDGFDADD
ncbi:peptidoglycan editing factor PgeF [Tahibacter caeni]|uniref:peptidoglycan editing factor PgeF n=1 Tax=Tahibacter caeni TaxID=1453545 RepID=UPI0027D26CE7|nr:peptidoglycan editing factor PgeF [Tahibacter caeni]